jgi:hypothetical protein
MVSNDSTLPRCPAQRLGMITLQDVGFWNPLARIVGEVLSSTEQAIVVDISPYHDAEAGPTPNTHLLPNLPAAVAV